MGTPGKYPGRHRWYVPHDPVHFRSFWRPSSAPCARTGYLGLRTLGRQIPVPAWKRDFPCWVGADGSACEGLTDSASRPAHQSETSEIGLRRPSPIPRTSYAILPSEALAFGEGTENELGAKVGAEQRPVTGAARARNA